jgi:hypothetical protein
MPRINRLSWPTALCALLGVGCSDYQVAAQEGADGLAAALTADPPMVDFGLQPRGVTSTARVDLINPGEVDLRLDELALGAPFSLSAAPPDRIPAGGSVGMELSYTASGETDEGMLDVYAGEHQLRLPLSGGALAPGLAIEPPVLELGPVFGGCAIDFELELWNPGSAPARVEGLGLIGEHASLDEELAADLELQPGEGIVLHGVVEAPASAPDATALDSRLLVRGSQPAIELQTPVLAEVAARPTREERFYQDGPWSALDLVVVVDRSGSMAEERMKLAEGSRTLFATLEEQELDWQVGVLTEDSGCFNGVVGHSDVVDESAFLSLMEGDWGRLTESGLSLARNAVEASGEGGCNAGFFRDGARPAFLFLSDEAEQSDAPWDELVEQLQSWDPAVSLSAVVGPAPDGCDTAGPGHGYLDAAAATGGSQLSICETDWRPWLADESARLSGQPTGTFPLAAVPAEGGMVEVWVDDEPQMEFTVDLDIPALVFPAHAWPGPGARIDVVYTEDVGCGG